MSNGNLHRLLRRQIKEQFGDVSQVPDAIKNFLMSVNDAYRDYDSDLLHSENILKRSSQELFKKNGELNALNSQLEVLIAEKTRDLSDSNRNLQNAEKITKLGNFSLNLNSNEISFSSHCCEMLNIIPENNSFTFKSLCSLFHEEEKMLALKEEIVTAENKIVLSQLMLKMDDEQRIFKLQCEYVSDDQGEKMLVGVIRDITEQRKREKALQDTVQQLENYKRAFDHAGIVSKSDANGKITYVNKLFEEISGYTESELLGADHNIVNSGHHPAAFFTELWRTISSGKIWKGVIKNKRKDGTLYWVDTSIIPFLSNNKIQEYIAIRWDITDKVQVHERVEATKLFYESVLNNIPVDIAVFNDKHQYLYINPNAAKNEEVRKFLIGKDDFDYCASYGKDPEIAVKRRTIFNEVKRLGSPAEYIDDNKNALGHVFHSLRRFFPVFGADKQLQFVIGFGIDITENIEKSNKIEESLKEKETLLGEVHHRVKNNLALVLGLIEMQITKSTTEDLRNQLSEVQRRIFSMSLIHEKLYKTSNFAKIDLSDYLKDLIQSLGTFYNKGKSIQIHYDLNSVLISTKKAIPVALVVNELITNCFKYAFNEREKGNIHVSLKRENEFTSLTIADDGPGLPENYDLTKTKSLGFNLLVIFTKQLKGTYKVSNLNGLQITINFKDEQEGFNS
jgi:PAS domain S-box-containing protein